mmetsp:Transcript_31780/g.56113  ORF Transcript_31780/g.56113 Transcript_31780/m.56113 type:complete len:148 (-) Transcript_31780:96-539(-)
MARRLFGEGVAKLKALRGGRPNDVGSLVRDGASAVASSATKVHGAVHRRLFEGEAPSAYRLRANKYDWAYGSQKRGDGKSMQHLTPYLTSGILASMAVFFIVFPMTFNRNYAESKKKYEKFARENADRLNTQFDRGQFSQTTRRGER